MILKSKVLSRSNQIRFIDIRPVKESIIKNELCGLESDRKENFNKFVVEE